MDECGGFGSLLEKEAEQLVSLYGRTLTDRMLIANEHFENLTPLSNEHEYECCTFKSCDLGSVNLSATKFIESTFSDSNLSNVRFDNTSMLDVSFEGCKMIGIPFDQSNQLLFSAFFRDCQLNHSIFHGMKLKQCSFENCSLEEADFTASDMKGIKLIGCDLFNAAFDVANLEEVDFLGSYRLMIDPEQTRLTKAKFSVDQLPGLLAKYNLKVRK